MSWKKFHRDYLNFSRAERSGILGLCGCILLMLIMRWSLPYWIKHQLPDTSAFDEEIAQFRMAARSASPAQEQTEPFINLQSVSELFFFDPNRTTDGDWYKLGLNERQIRNIRNYQANGGYFKRKEDLQKLYTISTTQYQLLEPYIRLSGNEPSVRQTVQSTSVNAVTEEPDRMTANSQKETKLRIELNTADSSLLTQLPGIGPVLAARTVRYRNLIGGFADVAQLNEVYGVNPDLVERLRSQLYIDSIFIRKISVNTATFNDLTRHPYLNEQQVRGIMNYRRLQNRINSLDELVRNNILKREEAERIRSYLTFD